LAEVACAKSGLWHSSAREHSAGDNTPTRPQLGSDTATLSLPTGAGGSIARGAGTAIRMAANVRARAVGRGSCSRANIVGRAFLESKKYRN
jgi:hypothetical protein